MLFTTEHCRDQGTFAAAFGTYNSYQVNQYQKPQEVGCIYVNLTKRLFESL